MQNSRPLEPGSYTVDPDCTGSFFNKLNNLVVLNGGRERLSRKRGRGSRRRTRINEKLTLLRHYGSIDPFCSPDGDRGDPAAVKINMRDKGSRFLGQKGNSGVDRRT
jgi:hypothetical protein